MTAAASGLKGLWHSLWHERPEHDSGMRDALLRNEAAYGLLDISLDRKNNAARAARHRAIETENAAKAVLERVGNK